MQSIGIADKSTLDLIKQDTTMLLKQAFVSRYYKKEGESVGETGVYTPIVEVMGSGYLYGFLLATKTMTSFSNTGFRVTLDDDVIYHSTNGSIEGTTSYYYLFGGMTPYFDIISNLSTLSSISFNIPRYDFPYELLNNTSLNNIGYAVIPHEIYFKNNLKVELFGNANTTTNLEVIYSILQ